MIQQSGASKMPLTSMRKLCDVTCVAKTLRKSMNAGLYDSLIPIIIHKINLSAFHVVT